MDRILVTTAHVGGTAAVRRARGALWLTAALERGGGTQVDRRVVFEAVAGARLVVGGSLPAGATRAIATAPDGHTFEAACGNGAWLAVVGQGDIMLGTPVRFEDAQGRVVATPLPRAWAREAVADAGESCPACSGSTWERVTPADRSYGHDGAGRATAAVICTRCGHDEPEGVFYAPLDREPPDSDAVEAALQEHREIARAALDDLLERKFPLYAVAGLPAELSGWGDGSATVRHGDDLVVETDLHAEPSELARRAMGGMLGEAEWPNASTAAITLALAAHDRARERALARADPLAADLVVDGGPLPFAGASTGDVWGVARRIGGVSVALAGRGSVPDGVALHRLG